VEVESVCAAHLPVAFGCHWRHFVRRTQTVAEEDTEEGADMAQLDSEECTLGAEKRHTGPAGQLEVEGAVDHMLHRAGLVGAVRGHRRRAQERRLGLELTLG
jgi:hypothetical protein